MFLFGGLANLRSGQNKRLMIQITYCFFLFGGPEHKFAKPPKQNKKDIKPPEFLLFEKVISPQPGGLASLGLSSNNPNRKEINLEMFKKSK